MTIFFSHISEPKIYLNSHIPTQPVTTGVDAKAFVNIQYCISAPIVTVSSFKRRIGLFLGQCIMDANNHSVSTAREEKGWGQRFFHQIEPITDPCRTAYSNVPVPRLRDAAGRKAGSPIAVYARVHCQEPKIGQEKVQFYFTFLSSYFLSMPTTYIDNVVKLFVPCCFCQRRYVSNTSIIHTAFFLSLRTGDICFVTKLHFSSNSHILYSVQGAFFMLNT